MQAKTNRSFNVFIDLKSLEFEVPTICLVTGCVSGHRDRRCQTYSDALLRQLVSGHRYRRPEDSSSFLHREEEEKMPVVNVLAARPKGDMSGR